MYTFGVHEHINALLKEHQIDVGGKDNQFYTRFLADTSAIFELYLQLYEHYPAAETLFDELITTIIQAYKQRPAVLKQRDIQKLEQEYWFLSNKINGMSLYVDRFCGNIKTLETKLDYFENLGVNFLHLMPVFESPVNESDGGYAVSNFRKVDDRFGSLEDLLHLQDEMRKRNMYLMIDIVLNHTSHKHEWALKAKAGEKKYQDYFYFYHDRSLPDQYDKTMPEIFPESSPGSFTYIEECNKWVMTVFHNYQWDLNYTNPLVFIEMLDTIFFYANLGVDILRIDAPAFIWKQLGTTCQNLPQAHTLLRLIKQCVQVASPGMALLGEAIVAPKEIMKYFGTDNYTARECDFAYNATHMALQWDMLATGDTKVMLAAQHELLQKPYGTSWITYTRCHDDIGLGYDDSMIEQAGYNSYAHRKYLKEYYSGVHQSSPAVGALFSSNPKTGDARISGSLASLCGLEKAINEKNQAAIDLSIQKIVMMQAHSFFLGGVPMIFYGDEVGYTNDYSYLQDAGKSYDNRWMHRPVIDWTKNKKAEQKGTVEETVFSATKKLLAIRGQLPVVADRSNLIWLTPHNVHVAGYIRHTDEQRLFCVFNFSNAVAYLTWYAFKEKGNPPTTLVDHWSGKTYEVGQDHEFLVLPPYGFALLEG
ncbi:alpha-amylase family glycosyl hydrolase [Lacibacter sp.]|uniref:alpha-amylase family glycosyl hydrolase n=1 Tax=Lacibacter sp. TaxID=1915409 RepID=UPI002B4ACDC8|nr:alpha-amylase family glycosyl hydrolase [Lacibacter sp.]HLP37948.1 alpha-amylase family glycosyl hydrolase [Lacibacter sp.]